MATNQVIEVRGLRKVYAGTIAVEAVDLDVAREEIFGIVGPNGAGKTTTVECMASLRRPDAGSIRVLGLDPVADQRAVREVVGVQLQQSALPARLRVREALDLFAAYYPQPLDVGGLLADWQLTDKANTAVASLSGGQRQRLFIALALVGNPEIVVLDELTTGLDPHVRRDTWALVQGLRDRGVTVVLVTHFMDEVERLCDRVAVIAAGRVTAIGTPVELTELAANRGAVSSTFEDTYLALTGAGNPTI
jgi:ABC-2 type transport system ATP-binding protein